MSSLFVLPSKLSEMLRPGLVRSCVILALVTLLAISQIELTSAKALGLSQDYWSSPGGISKRNSWWSKKSLDSAPDYQSLRQGPAFQGMAVGSRTADTYSDDIQSLYGCYVDNCAPEFVSCAQTSRTETAFKECKSNHRLCSLKCWVDTTEAELGI